MLCDLDEVPIYVGKSIDGIRNGVRRHLTSARSDTIAKRRLDVWEVAFVWAYPCVTNQYCAPKSIPVLRASRTNSGSSIAG